MKLTDKVKTILVWLAIPGGIVASWVAIGTILSTVVWASDYKKDQRLQKEFNLSVLINITADRCRRTVEPALKESCKRELARHEKQLEKLLERKVK